MLRTLQTISQLITGTARDLAPIVVVVAFFQIVVLKQPFPNLEATLIGLVMVLLGLSLFLMGLEMALFPIGEAMAGAFAALLQGETHPAVENREEGLVP